MNVATMKNRWKSVAAVGVFLLASATSASAGVLDYLHLDPNSGETVSLADLVSGEIAGLVVGDKLFDNFEYSRTGNMPTSELVSLSGITDADGNYGIRFQGAFLDLLDVGEQFASDASIAFEVAVAPDALAQGWRITAAHLAGSGVGDHSLFGPGSFVNVAENFVGNDPPTDQGMTVFASNFGPGGIQLEDWVDFDSLYERLRVQKDIAAFSAGTGPLPAQISIIDQTFGQVQNQVPEPATAVLLLGSLLGSACFMRYRLG